MGKQGACCPIHEKYWYVLLEKALLTWFSAEEAISASNADASDVVPVPRNLNNIEDMMVLKHSLKH